MESLKELILSDLQNILPYIILFLIGYPILKLFHILVIKPTSSPLSTLPSPGRGSLITGNLQRIFDEEPGLPQIEWIKTLGPVVRYFGMMGSDRLLFSDPVALNHILLTKSYDYPKPEQVRSNLTRILGKGILFAEGEDHKRQKKIMSPAFAPSHVKALVPIFFTKSYLLREKWQELISNSSVDFKAFKDQLAVDKYESNKVEGEIVLDVSPWLSKLTLDIVSLSGFGTDFNTLDGGESPLADAFVQMLVGSGSKMTGRRMLIGNISTTLLGYVPWILPYLPVKRIQQVRKGFEIVDKESSKILEQKKLDLKNGGIDFVGGGKDLITLLLKSSLVDSKLRMTDAELQGQVTTLLLAGFETTSTTLTWSLYILAKHPKIQQKLRDEIRQARKAAIEKGQEEIESEDLASLEYLDAFTREILRLESPVANTLRSAAFDDVIPLSEPITLKDGTTTSSISVKKGQTIFISINAVNQDPKIFGEDADEFKPERWINNTFGEKSSATVGVYSSILTFLSGHRACIGYRFALLELKAALVTIVDEFQFELREPDMKLERRSALVTRPYIIGEEDQGPRMPLRMSIAPRG